MSVELPTVALPEPKIRIRLTDEWTKRQAAFEVDGAYWDGAEGCWMVDDPSPRAASIALALFPELIESYPELVDIRASGYGTARPTDYATGLGLSLGRSAEFDNGRVLFEFQDTDVAYVKAIIERDKGAFIGWSRGLGKTTAAAALIRDLGYERTLVVCSNTAKLPVWALELGELLPGHRIVVLPNAKAHREECLRLWRTAPTAKPSVLIVHYESLALIAGKNGGGEGWNKVGGFDCVVFDEAHRLSSMKPRSSRNTQLGKAAMKMRGTCDHALVLTGSGIMNRPDDLFGPLHFMFPERYKSVWKDWNDRFVDFVAPYGHKVALGWKPDKLADLRAELGVFMVYRTKEDELDLPGRIVEERRIELGTAQRKAYEEMRDQFWTKVESGELIQATNRLAQLNHLRRIATGLGEYGVEDSSKIDFAMDLIEQNDDEAFVVFSWYKAPLREMAERLERAGINYHIVDGDVPQKQRDTAIEAFMAGEGRVFLGTLSTLGESVNLQRANNAIFLDRAWNPQVNAQAEDRIYRIGQTRPVTITHLIAKDTVDELRVLPVLASKDALRKAVFG